MGYVSHAEVTKTNLANLIKSHFTPDPEFDPSSKAPSEPKKETQNSSQPSITFNNCTITLNNSTFFDKTQK